MPPIEKPSTSALFRPTARVKATALPPICSNVAGTSPELLETPALLNKITSRPRAKPFRYRRIPVIHGAQVVLVENERDAGCLAKAAIGKADSVSFEELRRRGLVGVCGHEKSS